MIRNCLFAVVCLSAMLQLNARNIYIVRHGQSHFKEYYDYEVREPKLTPLGREQALLLGQYLKEKYNFQGTILVSPILRTVETGAVIAGVLNRKIVLEAGIQEVNYGHDRTCMTLAQVEARFPGQVTAPADFTHPWRVVNETKEMWRQRYIREMDRILQSVPGDLLLVTHGGGIVSMVNELCRRGKFRFPGGGYNCALFVFELDENNTPVKVDYSIEYISREKITDNHSFPFRKKTEQ